MTELVRKVEINLYSGRGFHVQVSRDGILIALVAEMVGGNCKISLNDFSWIEGRGFSVSG